MRTKSLEHPPWKNVQSTLDHFVIRENCGYQSDKLGYINGNNCNGLDEAEIEHF